MVELDEQIGFIIVHKETKKRIGFRLSGKSKGVKSIWSKIGLAKSAFCYHTGIIFAEQTYYEIKEIKWHKDNG